MKILKNGRRRMAMLTPALALALIPFSAGTASANTTPGWGDDMPDVLWDCNNNNADSCQYHEQNAETELDKRRQVSNVISNCASNRDLTVTRTVTDTRSTEYAFEQETSVEVSAGFSDAFEAGMKASDTQSETWKVGEAHTATETRTTTVPAGQQGAWWFAPYVRHSQGWLEVHYGERNHGHYFWYYRGPGGLPAIDVKTPVFLPTGELKGNFYWATWNC